MAQSFPHTHSSPLSRPPGTDAPPACEVPHFAPLRARGGGYRLRRLARHRRRAVAAGLAVTAAALVAAGPQDPGRSRGHPDTGPPARATSRADHVRRGHAVQTVTAPVRIADAATVRLLRSGDRIDVIAAESGGETRVLATAARVTDVPDAGEGMAEDGALVVLSVPRATAARLAGASTTSRLAVTLCRTC